MIEPMTRYAFVLLSGDQTQFLSDLSELGVVDITRSSKPVDAESAALLTQADRLSKAISRIQAADYSKDPDLKEILAIPVAPSDDPLTDAEKTQAQIVTFTSELTALQKEIKARMPWGAFDNEAIGRLGALGYKVRFYTVSRKLFDPAWAEQYPLQVVQEDDKTVWFVTISDDPSYSFPVAEVSAPAETAAQTREKQEKVASELLACKARMLALKEAVPGMEKERDRLLKKLDRYLAHAGGEGAAENHLAIFHGFVPDEDDEKVTKALEEMPVVYLKQQATLQDDPPIKLKNNAFTRMFSVLTDMYGRPEYNEFDPTPYLSVFFLLFFAMCMGDAGYGLLLIIIGFVLKKVKGMADLSPLVVTLGAGTFVVGIVMHTFFGVDISALPWIPAWLKKCMITGTIGGFEAQMVLSLVIGIIHLCLAMVVKTVYATRNQGFLGSLGVWGWTLLIVGGVIVGTIALFGLVPATVTKWIVIVLGVVSAAGIFLFNDIHRSPLKNIGAGLWETYNTVTGLLGDVLSYLRLYALGLAGGMLGKAFNDIAAMTLGDGGFGIGWIFFILILVVGHALNLAMCCLGAFVHPLRLNFLEFFKNSGYSGKGRTYRPLETGTETK